MLVVQSNKEILIQNHDHNHDKAITTPEFNTLAADVFNGKLPQANLVTKTDFDNKLSSLNRKITSNKTKHLLIENELKKLKTFDSIYFRGKSHFEKDGTQNYLVFQPMYRYFKRVIGVGTGNYIDFWKSKGLSDENITAPSTSDYKLNPQLSYFGTKTRVDFRGSCLKQDKITFNYGKIVNIYIVYELNKLYSKATPDNQEKDILVLGKGPMQGLGEHSLTAEKMYSVNFTDHRKKYCLSLHYNGANSYLFVNGTEITKFKVKDSEIVATPLCLGNISKD